METSTILSYANIVGAIACFIIPTWELLFKKTEKKWVHRISAIGWICFSVAGYIAVISIWTINASESERLSAYHIADSTRRADKREIIDSIINHPSVTNTVLNTMQFEEMSFIPRNNQLAFKTPGSPADIKAYTVNINGLVCNSKFFKVSKGKVTLLPLPYKLDSEDIVVIKWVK